MSTTKIRKDQKKTVANIKQLQSGKPTTKHVLSLMQVSVHAKKIEKPSKQDVKINQAIRAEEQKKNQPYVRLFDVPGHNYNF